jgi:hypothetical protein
LRSLVLAFFFVNIASISLKKILQIKMHIEMFLSKKNYAARLVSKTRILLGLYIRTLY